MSNRDEPFQRRPPTQTYARVPKRAKLHHQDYRPYVEDSNIRSGWQGESSGSGSVAGVADAAVGVQGWRRQEEDYAHLPGIEQERSWVPMARMAGRQEENYAHLPGIEQERSWVPMARMAGRQEENYAPLPGIEVEGSRVPTAMVAGEWWNENVRRTSPERAWGGQRLSPQRTIATGRREGTIDSYFSRIPVAQNDDYFARETRVTGAATSTVIATAAPAAPAVAAPPAPAPEPVPIAYFAVAPGNPYAGTPIRVPTPPTRAPSLPTPTSSTSTGRNTASIAISTLLNPPESSQAVPVPRAYYEPRPVPPSPELSPNTGTDTSTRKKKKGPPVLQVRKLTQLQLDLGQPTLPITCSTCFMSYSPSNYDDELLHRKFHAKCVGGVDFVTSYSKVLWCGLGFIKEGRGRESERIVRVSKDSNHQEKKRVMEVMEVVETELGCQKLEEDDIWGKGRKERGNTRLVTTAEGKQELVNWEEDEAARYTVFAYVLGRKCVGLLLTERINKAYPVKLFSSSSTSSATDIHPSTPCTTLVLAPHPRPALLGIARIWTCSTYRRRGIATRLIDTARQAFIYGMIITKHQVAFSQPTALGKAFAREWFDRTANGVGGIGAVEFAPKVRRPTTDGAGWEEDEEGAEAAELEGAEGGQTTGWAVYLDEN